jgi:hypothetical protein
MVIPEVVASHQFSYDKAYWSKSPLALKPSCVPTGSQLFASLTAWKIFHATFLLTTTSLHFIFFTVKQPEESKKATFPRTWNLEHF